MILAVDIGNTNIVIGGIREGEIAFEARIATDRIKTSDQYGAEIKSMLSLFDITPQAVDDCIISSVVPPVFNSVRTGVLKVIGKKPLVVGPGIKTGLNIQMDSPSQVGSDRIVIAVAALAEYTPPLCLLDMGTATTLSVIDGQGNYLGGMIIPGLRLSVDSLSARAAQLPYINLDEPEQLIGTNTISCMQAGAIYSNAAMIDGLLERVEAELGGPVAAIATGGLIAKVLPYCRRQVHYDENLMLEGLQILYRRNSGNQTPRKEDAPC